MPFLSSSLDNSLLTSVSELDTNNNHHVVYKFNDVRIHSNMTNGQYAVVKEGIVYIYFVLIFLTTSFVHRIGILDCLP